jgi:dinuclear metal center YbgI/SA1388 family protein
MPPLREVSAYLDRLLRIAEIPDYPPALNGLQLENSGTVTQVAAAVDFSRVAIEGAVAAGANLLLVHHGMFWSGARPLVGQAYERMRLLMSNDIAVYAAHLPLDVHPELGNNVLLARALGLDPGAGFAKFQAIDVGVRGACDLLTSELLRRAGDIAKEHGGVAVSTPFDASRRSARWAICTGAGASSDTVREALAAGVDTLIVGEGPHHTAVEAMDQGLVIIYAGHYATETLGVVAVAAEIERTFGMPWQFVSSPSGL